ncbi:MAG: winged helix-turn-helix domain-containing protein, partial [Acidobacteriota bacterium]|nr:winged helix-turn-helix domain-containing protein [Acidobacteriota bacterium]
MNESQPQNYEFGDFRVDPSKRLLITGDGEPVPLTPKVFDLLLYLVRHAGKLIEKDELMTEIWADTIVEENNLSQNISILRRALGEKRGENHFIATVPGRGYKFVASVEVQSSKSEVQSLKSLEIPDSRFQIPDSFAEDQKPKTKNQNPKLIIGLTVLGILALSSLGFYLWRENTKSVGNAPIKTIAVLPFKPLVLEHRDEALEMGMADTLIARLGDNREIVVRPLSSVRKFGNLEQDVLVAGRALDVEAILDGNIQRWGEKIRVNVRLIKTADGTALWTGTFEEKFTNIFVVQDAISNRVAAALELRLSGDEKMRLTKRYTENVEAYQLYLRGRFHVFKLTPPEIQKGIGYFQQAIELDPKYALAYAGLSDAYRSLAIGSEMPPPEFLPKAIAAATRAVEIDDNLSEAHTALGASLFWGDWNWNESENQFKRALELSPNEANVHIFYAHLLSNIGRHTEALAEIKRAREFDPLFPFAGALEGQFLLHAGQPDEALDRLRKTFELAPNFWMPHVIAASVYTEKGMFEEAVAEARKARELLPAQTVSVAYEGYALAKLGENDEARTLLNELLKLSETRFVPPYHFAMIYNGLGETDKTFEWLEKGYRQRDPKM